MTLTHALGKSSRRVTGARRKVAELIDRRSGHFTAADLVADARARQLRVGRASIFRALDLFTELNVLERVDLPTGEHAYVACEPAHHHHLICRRCGRVADVDDARIEAVADEMARRTGYQIDSHRLELYGLCPDCASEQPGVAR